MKHNYNSIFSVLAKLFELGKSFLLILIAGRYLDVTQFGVFSLLISISAIIGIVAEFRLQEIIFRNIKSQHDITKVVGNTFVISLVFSIFGFFIITFIGSLDYTGNYDFIYMLYGLNFIFNSTRVIKFSLIAKGFSIQVIVIELISLVTVSFYFYLNIFGVSYDVLSFVKVKLIDTAIISTLILSLYFKIYGFSLVIYKVDVKAYFNGSLPLVFSGIAVLLYQKLDVIVIKWYLGFEQLGIYVANYSLVSIFSLVPVVICQMYSGDLHTNNGESPMKYMKKMNLVGFLFSFIYLILAYPLGDFIYSGKYNLDYYYYMFFSIIPLISAVGASSTQIMIAKNIHKKVWIKSILSLLLNLLLNVVLVQNLGLFGCLLATVISLIIANYFMNYLMNDYKDIFRIQTRSFIYDRKK
ncbi:oligosaccharide flippase family protein [Pseudoalteromonas ulvae]|nr:oligosaccharide flippase family protein [Pseudoalteromonas ulvae]